ncbi:MAG: acetate--CoA ligase family protein [Magnetococcales bacterium]|nr:acetate--CoA ligase family protein [Magnetococcales bacterium]MBF0438408.1 acetate--CoA ligase family protein [Magnetococcales bacterium]
MSYHTNLLTPLLSPRSMAIVGASRHAEKLGYTLLANALSSGFAGPVYAVNPNGGEVLGQTLLQSLTACPRGVDLVVLAVPAYQVLEQAKLAMGRGCGALVVVTDGFGELNPEGAKQEVILAKICQDRNVLLLGPNSLGVLHRQLGMNASLTLAFPPVGGIALLSQSGAMAAAALDWMVSRNLGISKMISPGNEAGITMAHAMTFLAHDPDTKVIACYLERIIDGAGFLKAATEASRNKPVVLLLGGHSAWREHQLNDSILSPAVFAAACDRTGIIQTPNFQTWLDVMMTLSRSIPPDGSRVAVITNGLGPGLLTADMLEHHELTSVGLSPALIATLHPMLHQCSILHGPLDLCGIATPSHFRATVEAVRQDEQIDAILTVVTPQPLTRPEEIAQALLAESGKHKPLLTVWMGGEHIRHGAATMDQMGVANFPTPERAAAAMSALDHYGRWRRRGPRIISGFTVNRSRVGRLLQRNQVLNMRRLNDLESKQILHAYGIPIPSGEKTTTVNEALEMAERLGYPVSLHLLSPELHLAHDMASRLVHVTGPQGVQDGFDLLTLRFAKRVPDGQLDGVFVEKNVAHGHLIRMGMHRDEQFGPLLYVGMCDPSSPDETVYQLAPITSEESLIMLRSVCRHHTKGDPCAMMNENEWLGVAEVLQRIGQLATDFSVIRRIEINPLIIRRAGLPPVATECVIELRSEACPVL